MRLSPVLLVVAALAGPFAGGALAQQAVGTVSRLNQDADSRPSEQSMQPVGGSTRRPGLNVRGPVQPRAAGRSASLLSHTAPPRTHRHGKITRATRHRASASR